MSNPQNQEPSTEQLTDKELVSQLNRWIHETKTGKRYRGIMQQTVNRLQVYYALVEKVKNNIQIPEVWTGDNPILSGCARALRLIEDFEKKGQ